MRDELNLSLSPGEVHHSAQQGEVAVDGRIPHGIAFATIALLALAHEGSQQVRRDARDWSLRKECIKVIQAGHSLGAVLLRDERAVSADVAILQERLSDIFVLQLRGVRKELKRNSHLAEAPME